LRQDKVNYWLNNIYLEKFKEREQRNITEVGSTLTVYSKKNVSQLPRNYWNLMSHQAKTLNVINYKKKLAIISLEITTLVLFVFKIKITNFHLKFTHSIVAN
jgi:hypothetical protein